MAQKYNFRGIKKLGSNAMIAVLATSLTKFGLGFLVNNRVSYLILSFFIEKYVNAMANQGLILLNTGAMLVTTHLTEKALIDAWRVAEDAILKAKLDGLPLTKEKVRAIDDEVFDAFYRHAIFVA